MNYGRAFNRTPHGTRSANNEQAHVTGFAAPITEMGGDIFNHKGHRRPVVLDVTNGSAGPPPSISRARTALPVGAPLNFTR
jgi:hypothetical protein